MRRKYANDTLQEALRAVENNFLDFLIASTAKRKCRLIVNSYNVS